MTTKAIRQLLAVLSLGGLLLATSPVLAARRAKGPAESPAGTAPSTGPTCTTGTCSPAADTVPSGDVDSKLGTALTWMPTPDAAAKAAADEGKLVFMIQVSGNFARQEFT